MYEQTDQSEIESLIRALPSCTLVTNAADGRIESGPSTTQVLSQLGRDGHLFPASQPP